MGHNHGCPRADFASSLDDKPRGGRVGRSNGSHIDFCKGGRVAFQKSDKPRASLFHFAVQSERALHQLIRALEADGEPAAASLLAKLGSKAEIARELAYRLYTIAERKKRAVEALSYNALVQSWPEIERLTRAEARPAEPAQAALL